MATGPLFFCCLETHLERHGVQRDLDSLSIRTTYYGETASSSCHGITLGAIANYLGGINDQDDLVINQTNLNVGSTIG